MHLPPMGGGLLVALSLLLLLPLSSAAAAAADLHLTTNAQGYLTVIQGFATQLQCILNSCSNNVNWYKDDVLIFNATKFVKESSLKEESFLLQHQIDFDFAKECSTACSDSTAVECAAGSSCLDGACCPCQREHFTLILKNLTFEDAGRYRCQVGEESEQLEFQVEVLESGLRGGFHHNISYDHSECCEEKGISPLCRAMCKPSDMHKYHFDPTSCKTEDYKNFLSCATDGGNRSHVHCCKAQLVPSFCYDLCSNEFTMLRRAHRLCLYYLPEIFDCYNRAYLPFPDPPDEVVVNAVDSDKLEVCWKPPKVEVNNADYPVVDYTLYYKQIPSFPFLGSENEEGFPLLSSDYSDLLNGDYDEHEMESVEKRKKRDVETIAADFSEITRAEGDEELSRKKRQTFVFVANDEGSNSSTVREFKFQMITTTKTCETIADLRSAARYIIYVTSRNEYGSSVPSIRSIASTNIEQISSNTTIPDTMACCTKNGVSSYCSAKMCTVGEDPSSIAVLSIATSCRHEWPKVSPCLADGRNHTSCCMRKGVDKECLGICSGSIESLGVHSVLCLNLDLAAIYQCLREGYETHPSPPKNVRVESVSERTAQISWAEPETNGHLVANYTLFIRKNQHGEPVRTIPNAISPHVEMNLDPDSSYSVSVQSHSDKGVSLPSTTVLFQTRPDEYQVCQTGEPLYLSDGKPFMCGLPSTPCPIHYTCVENEDENEGYCCPNARTLSFEPCCRKMGVVDECMSICNHNSTVVPDNCVAFLNPWIKCASDGHDHSRCCLQEEVHRDCHDACLHPFNVLPTCISEAPKLARCFSSHHSQIPLAVRNIQVVSLSMTSVELKWDATPNMKIFEVQLLGDGALLNRTNTTVASLTIDGLNVASTYAARVIAFNDAGSSPPSFNVTFSTLAQNGNPSEPRAPRAIRIAWNRGTSANVTWQAVTEKADGRRVERPIAYTLYYVDVELSSEQWQVIRTNSTWAVMINLRRDAFYSLYVTAQEGDDGPVSRNSNVLTLIAQSDSFGLPEPVIVLTPRRSGNIYELGEKLTANCTLDENLIENKPNIDLHIGEEIIANEPGQSFVVRENFDVVESPHTIACYVSATDGRTHVALAHIYVKFGPVVRMQKAKVRALDDLSAEINCVVEGIPVPDVHFEFQGSRVDGETRVITVKPHSFLHTLIIRNVTGYAGFYTCVAEKDGKRQEDRAELVVANSLLPINPRLVLDCCEREGIQGECLEVCSIGERSSHANCSAYSSSLLKCAIDNRDHADCCVQKRVSRKCLPLCSGDSFSPDVDCSEHAVDIMSCFVLGHESAPLRPENLRVSMMGENKIRVEWDHYMNDNAFVYYAVYYKKLDDDSDDYRVQKTRDEYIDLDVDDDYAWDIGVMAANAYGHSALTYVQSRAGREQRPSSLFPFLIFFIIAIACGCVLYVGRRLNQAGTTVSSFLGRNQSVARDDPTVAFENPGFGNELGDEVEIRGLGSVGPSDWHRNDLEGGARPAAHHANAKLSM